MPSGVSDAGTISTASLVTENEALARPFSPTPTVPSTFSMPWVCGSPLVTQVAHRSSIWLVPSWRTIWPVTGWPPPP